MSSNDSIEHKAALYYKEFVFLQERFTSLKNNPSTTTINRMIFETIVQYCQKIVRILMQGHVKLIFIESLPMELESLRNINAFYKDPSTKTQTPRASPCIEISKPKPTLAATKPNQASTNPTLATTKPASLTKKIKKKNFNTIKAIAPSNCITDCSEF